MRVKLRMKLIQSTIIALVDRLLLTVSHVFTDERSVLVGITHCEVDFQSSKVFSDQHLNASYLESTIRMSHRSLHLPLHLPFYISNVTFNCIELR